MKDKINRKYYPLIWISLVVATLISQFINYYVIALTDYSSRSDMFVDIVTQIISTGISVALVYVLALLLYSIGFRRYVRSIPRNDFCYWVMAFTAVARFVTGLISVFALLDENILFFTDGTIDVALEGAAMFAMYFGVMRRLYKLNPVEDYNAFRFYGMIYVIVLGILTLLSNSLYLMLAGDGEIAAIARQVVIESGQYIDEHMGLISAICAFSVYGAILIAYITLTVIMKKRARRFQDPETRETFYEQPKPTGGADISSAYSDLFEDGDNKDSSSGDSPFDEFDL